MLTLIAAIGKNNSLGKNNKLLWHLPDDFMHFKHLTIGHTIIMGRKTFESLPKLLPQRNHIVISNTLNYNPLGCHVVNSVSQAIDLAKMYDDFPFVIGGGQIYKQTIAYADKLEITLVNEDFSADTFFPEIDNTQWKLVQNIYHAKDERHLYDFYFQTYLRK